MRNLLMTALVFALSLPLLAGCFKSPDPSGESGGTASFEGESGSSGPGERITAARAEYSITLESFSAKPTNAPPAVERASEGAGSAVAIAAEAAEAASAEGEGEGEGEGGEGSEEPPSGPRQMDVVLQLLVRFGGEQPLPGITVDVVHTKGSGLKKPPIHHWIETAGMTKGTTKQAEVKLEGIEYEDGDVFSVEFLNHVPPEKRGQYREFSEASP